MLGRLGQFDGVVGNAIMLPLWWIPLKKLATQAPASTGTFSPEPATLIETGLALKHSQPRRISFFLHAACVISKPL